MTHKDEIKYWADHPNCTDVWAKGFNEQDWELLEHYKVNWSCVVCKFIVDDEWAELRKAQANGEQLQFKHFNGEWVDCFLDYNKMTIGPKNWRIKPKEFVYGYQYVIQYSDGTFDMTDHEEKEPVCRDDSSVQWKVVERYEPSKRERK